MMTGDTALDERAANIGKAFADIVRQSPSGFAQLMIALDFAVGPSYEVVIAGEPGSRGTTEMLRALGHAYVPNKVTLFLSASGDIEEIAGIAPFTRQMASVENKTTAYVCSKHSCQSPTTDVTSMLRSLNGG